MQSSLKFPVLLIVGVLFSWTAYPRATEGYSVMAGTTSSVFTNSLTDEEGGRTLTETSADSGFFLGFSWDIPLIGPFSLSPGIGVVSLGFTGAGPTGALMTGTINYLDIPFRIKLEGNLGKLGVFLHGGVNLGALLGASGVNMATGAATSLTDYYSYNFLGASGGAGFNIPMGKGWDLLAGGDYQATLTNLVSPGYETTVRAQGAQEISSAMKGFILYLGLRFAPQEEVANTEYRAQEFIHNRMRESELRGTSLDRQSAPSLVPASSPTPNKGTSPLSPTEKSRPAAQVSPSVPVTPNPAETDLEGLDPGTEESLKVSPSPGSDVPPELVESGPLD